jgi:hypothetical protein
VEHRQEIVTRAAEAPAQPKRMKSIIRAPKAPKPETELAAESAAEKVVISPPRFQSAVIHLIGSSPYVQHKFSQKAITLMTERQRAGSVGKKDRKRSPRDFEADYKAAMHVSTEGWCGIPAPAFRNAMISACRTAGFAMTRAKLSIFVEADGIDATDGMPLLRIVGEPQPHQSYARNESGVADIRWRPMWEKWSVDLKVRWDADQFSSTDVLNLIARAGMQVGVGEGRPDSPNSNGLGWGLWDIAEQ